jgi:DNA polymerase III epsilon subunit-like protein
MAGARCGEEDHSIRSLASLASEILGEVIHARGRRHCAIQDAEVARRLYYRLVDGSLNGTAP